jgi:hypothetical protein
MNGQYDNLFTHHNYVSLRGHPLLYVGPPLPTPIVTLENYCKWYEIHIVNPDGAVEKVPVQLIQQICDEQKKPLWIDHNFHPQLLILIAAHLKAEYDEMAVEVAAGRWVLECGEAPTIERD